MNRDIVTIFKNTEDNIKNLIDFLEKENQHLSVNLHKEVMKIIQQKKIIYDKILDNHQDMVSYLNLNNFPNSPKALAKHLKSLPDLQGNLLKKQWKNIIILLDQAENLNVKNSLTMITHKENTEKNLNILLEKIKKFIHEKKNNNDTLFSFKKNKLT